MATWHQLQRPVKLYHDTKWTVLIDPPNQCRGTMLFNTKALAEVYMRSLKANNPAMYRHALILRPGNLKTR